MSASQNHINVVPLSSGLRPWAADVLTEHWGSIRMVTRGRVHLADALPGFVAMLDGKPMGLATYHIEGGDCELVTLNSLRQKVGIGRRLLHEAIRAAKARGYGRLWLITTNDNLPALCFYQRHGFALKAVYPGALVESRRLKPEIPLIGLDGIPLRDEIELEYRWND